MEFNAGGKEGGFAYEVLDLWELSHPLSLKALKEKGYAKGPPQKYCWVAVRMKEEVEGTGLQVVFEK